MTTMLFVLLTSISNAPISVNLRHLVLWTGTIAVLFLTKQVYRQISAIWSMDFDIGPENMTLQEISDELNG